MPANYYEISEMLNKKFGGDWFWNISSNLYEDYLSGKVLTEKQAKEKLGL